MWKENRKKQLEKNLKYLEKLRKTTVDNRDTIDTPNNYLDKSIYEANTAIYNLEHE